MHDAMVVLQELEEKDVLAYRSDVAQIVTAPIAAPIAAPVAVAEAVDQSAIDEDVEKTDEESFAAMRWASKLDDDANVMSLLRSLPKQIVEEQVQLYRKRDETAVAARSAYAAKQLSSMRIPAISCAWWWHNASTLSATSTASLLTRECPMEQ